MVGGLKVVQELVKDAGAQPADRLEGKGAVIGWASEDYNYRVERHAVKDFDDAKFLC